MSRSRRNRSQSARITRYNANLDRIGEEFNPDTLRRICEMPERAFAEAYDMETVRVAQSSPADFYAFKDNGASILAVAHLDTVADKYSRRCNFLDTAGGTVVYSRALDDRLGAYVILDMLPKLGIKTDLLLTVGEETGNSTASFFDAPRDYNWVIEFDRGGTDVVMYQYEDDDTCDLVKAAGARVGDGSFSDISYLGHLGVKCFNWGVGYRDYHSARSHAYLDDTFTMVSQFMDFHAKNKDKHLPHTDNYYGKYLGLGSKASLVDEEEEEFRKWWAEVNLDDREVG